MQKIYFNTAKIVQKQQEVFGIIIKMSQILEQKEI